MIKKFTIAALILMSSQLSFAMTCGEQIIEGDQEQGLTIDQVKKLCGEPDETLNYGDDLKYKKDDGVYILHFNTEGILESIQEQDQQ